ncbi:uncharacterized protein VP01_3921g2 [Puccinia sorghi]|uniref:Uncharacterized protein n=1 Tax=Puccinia sorghi TaxID=27349 RepID=A0A0L6UUH5_9BASI|nr:uncharacterized protein VP01_3921g2 [Puccinia sorghi]
MATTSSRGPSPNTNSNTIQSNFHTNSYASGGNLDAINQLVISFGSLTAASAGNALSNQTGCRIRKLQETSYPTLVVALTPVNASSSKRAGRSFQGRRSNGPGQDQRLLQIFGPLPILLCLFQVAIVTAPLPALHPFFLVRGRYCN